MDDEDAIRDALYMMLSQNGHTVVHAANGTEAIQTFLRYKSEGLPFDLAILDLAISNDFGAKEVIVRIKEIDPLIPALLITGYRDDPVLTDYKSRGFVGALLKPFDYIQLNQAVNSALRRN
jgi:two-component system, cell cycle sensor histidine kinase and response regulator CckA